MYQQSPHHNSPTGQISPSPSPPGIAMQINGTQQPTPIGPQTEQEANDSDNKKMFQEIKGSLMVVAVLAAGATYQAGLSPPDRLDISSRRHTAFFYCNSTSFITSLVIIILLMNSRFNIPAVIKVLNFTMTLDLFGIMGAYAAGSCHDITSSIFLFVLMGGLFIYIILFAQIIHIISLAQKMRKYIPGVPRCMKNPA